MPFDVQVEGEYTLPFPLGRDLDVSDAYVEASSPLVSWCVHFNNVHSVRISILDAECPRPHSVRS